MNRTNLSHLYYRDRIYSTTHFQRCYGKQLPVTGFESNLRAFLSLQMRVLLNQHITKCFFNGPQNAICLQSVGSQYSSLEFLFLSVICCFPYPYWSLKTLKLKISFNDSWWDSRSRIKRNVFTWWTSRTPYSQEYFLNVFSVKLYELGLHFNPHEKHYLKNIK